jgi:hypothetical protein
MDKSPSKTPQIKLDYVAVSPKQPRPWLSTTLSNLNRPMPLGKLYLIMWVLSLLALAIILGLRAMIQALR